MNCRKEHWGLEFPPEEILACRARRGLLSLELELSRACNLRCVYCYASSGRALPDEMTRTEILSVIDQAAELGARKIIVLGGGEPLLYPDIWTIIDYIRRRQLRVDLFTNGTLLDREQAEALYRRDVSVSIKMNSAKSEVQDYLAGKPGAHVAIQKGLEALLAAGYPDEQHTLGIETIVCRQNYDELPGLWRWARQLGIIPYIEIMTSQGRATRNGSLEVDQQAIKALFERLAAIDQYEFGCEWTPMPPLAASHCARHEYSCTVTSIGDVQPCPGVNIAAGNIRRHPLAEIIATSKVIKELRDIRQNIKGSCASCRYNKSCYGCRGHAYQITGDYLAADPICWIRH